MAAGVGVDMTKEEVEGKKKGVKEEGNKKREGLVIEKGVRDKEVEGKFGGGGVGGSLIDFLGSRCEGGEESGELRRSVGNE